MNQIPVRKNQLKREENGSHKSPCASSIDGKKRKKRHSKIVRGIEEKIQTAVEKVASDEVSEKHE